MTRSGSAAVAGSGSGTGRRAPLSVVVLAYDEAENVAEVLAELRAWLETEEPEAEIVFVDDGSRDATAHIAHEGLAGARATIERHARNRGIGAALKTGVRVATGDWVTFLPADGQVPPEAIGMLRAAATPGVDVVLSVYDHRDDGSYRRILSAGVRALILAVHGVRLRSDGPYLFRREIFVPEQLAPDSFFLNFEFPIRAIGAGLGVTTTTIPCRARLAGHSKSTGLGRIAGVATDLLGLRVRRARETVRRARGIAGSP